MQDGRLWFTILFLVACGCYSVFRMASGSSGAWIGLAVVIPCLGYLFLALRGLVGPAGKIRRLFREARWVEAEQLLREHLAAGAQPAANLHLNLALVLRQQGKLMDARAAAADGLTIAPNDRDLRQLLVDLDDGAS